MENDQPKEQNSQVEETKKVIENKIKDFLQRKQEYKLLKLKSQVFQNQVPESTEKIFTKDEDKLGKKEPPEKPDDKSIFNKTEVPIEEIKKSEKIIQDDPEDELV